MAKTANIFKRYSKRDPWATEHDGVSKNHTNFANAYLDAWSKLVTQENTPAESFSITIDGKKLGGDKWDNRRKQDQVKG